MLLIIVGLVHKRSRRDCTSLVPVDSRVSAIWALTGTRQTESSLEQTSGTESAAPVVEHGQRYLYDTSSSWLIEG